MSIKGLDIVSPDKVEDGVLPVDHGGHAKTPLIPVLVELEVLQILPVLPIVLFQESSSHEMHDPCDVLSDVIRFDYSVLLYGTAVRLQVGPGGCSVGHV